MRKEKYFFFWMKLSELYVLFHSNRLSEFFGFCFVIFWEKKNHNFFLLRKRKVLLNRGHRLSFNFFFRFRIILYNFKNRRWHTRPNLRPVFLSSVCQTRRCPAAVLPWSFRFSLGREYSRRKLWWSLSVNAKISKRQIEDSGSDFLSLKICLVPTITCICKRGVTERKKNCEQTVPHFANFHQTTIKNKQKQFG